VEEQDLGYGNKIIGFRSSDEVLTYLEEQEALAQEAMKHLAQPQLDIGYGAYVLRVLAYGDNESLAIFGYIYTEDEVRELEINAGAGLNNGELESIMSNLRDSYARGYRYGTYHSMVVPQGEPGDAHLMSLWPITELDFEEARSNDWELSEHLRERVLGEIDEHKEENR